MTNKVISLDVFDTAIFRTVYEPKDIFKLVEGKVGGDFYNKRIEAEAKAAQKFTYYNIGDIYSFLRPDFSSSEEIDVEFANCIANQEILKIYNKNPKNYIFISDMYLPSGVIKSMLEKVGYKTPRVFVSCEEKACKGDGSLFKKVEEKLGVKIDTHYGDNYVADIEGAKKAGIRNVVFNPALHKVDMNLPMVKSPTLKKLTALWYNRKPEDKIALYHAPLIAEFTKWVLSKRQEGQKIFFLSRDMYMPYIIAKEELEANDVFYLHASRKSLANVCLQSPNEQLRTRIESLFSPEEIERRRKENLIETIKYFQQFNIKDGDLIVDIGYAGTIQAAIDSLLGVKTKGLYMQLADSKIESIDAEMFFNRNVIKYCLMVETVLGSPEDFVEGYKNGKVIFKKENKEKKKLAKSMTNTALHSARLFSHIDMSLEDIEQMLIHLQYYPTDDIIELFNNGIYSNKDFNENIIGFDKERILRGELRECYNKSYAKPLFIKLLEQDKELKHLKRLLV